jgi:Ca2+-binding EF-hand superfamily protein
MRAIMDLLGEDPEDDLLATMIRMLGDNNDGQVKWEEFCAKITGKVMDRLRIGNNKYKE